MKELERIISSGVKFSVPKRIRFREENGFYLVNARWGNTITLDDSVTKLLLKFQKNHTVFDVNSHKLLNAEVLSNLFYKDIIETSEIGSSHREEIQGLSFNFDSLEAIPK